MGLFWRLLNPLLPWGLQRRPDDKKSRPEESELYLVEGGRRLSGGVVFEKVRLENDADSARELTELRRRIGENSLG